MPFEVNPEEDCENCPYGVCVGYEPSGGVDRHPRFTLAKTVGWTCAYDSFVPGFGGEDYDYTYKEYVDQVFDNALKAGEYLYKEGHFDERINESNVEVEDFGFTSGTRGNVKGDTYEVLLRAGFWNSCAYWNKYIAEGDWQLDRGLPDTDLDEEVCVVGQPDGYDMRDLFTKKWRGYYEEVEERLDDRNARFVFSIPDAFVIRTTNLPAEVQQTFREPLSDISEDNRDLLERDAIEKLNGHVRPQDVVAAIGIKTTGRSDRTYQLAYEANGWKTLFRTVFGLEKARYYMVFRELSATDTEKTNESLWLPTLDIGQDGVEGQQAIEERAHFQTPSELKDWFFETLLKSTEKSIDEGFEVDVEELVDFDFQGGLSEF